MKNHLDGEHTWGVELEAVGMPKHDAAYVLNRAGIPTTVYGDRISNTPQGLHYTKYWNVVEDGSLRCYDTDGECGCDLDDADQECYCEDEGGETFEINSPAFKGSEGLEMLEKTCYALDRAGAEVNETCGVHVHHQAHDLKDAQLEGLLVLVQRAEMELDYMVATDRGLNNSDYAMTIQNLTTAERAINSDRCLKVNFSALKRHGTLEFRQHHGSLEGKEISEWVVLTQLLVNRARRGPVHISPVRLSWYELAKMLRISGDFKNRLDIRRDTGYNRLTGQRRARAEMHYRAPAKLRAALQLNHAVGTANQGEV